MQFKKRILQLSLPVLLGLILIWVWQPKRSQPTEQVESKQYRVAIELILEDEVLADSLARRLCAGRTKLECYRWNNHIVLFGEVNDTIGIGEQISQSYLGKEIKVYDSPMYVFDRAQHCRDSALENSWQNYLLTCNLVADSVMQQEYMQYHQTQFDKWPEVAAGFCQAQFQQLLVYRNGRQLMLIISIPADKTLDELNPKTEKNNPRVVEWNRLMGRYQEGIKGSAPGETWVFLNPVEIENK